MRWAGHVARIEEGRSAFKILTGTSIVKRSLGRPRWEDNIRMGLEEIGVNARNWVDSAQNRDNLKNPFEYDIESLDFVSHEVN